MLRLACVLLYQGRFKSHRSRGSRISLRVRSILVTFCIYFCNSYIILVLCAILCSFSILFHFQFSSVCILAICLCMHVCLCAVYRTALSIASMWRYKNLRASIFCFAGGGGAGPRAGGSVGAGGGGGGSVGRMDFGTSFAPRSPTSFAPRHNCNKVRVYSSPCHDYIAKRCYQCSSYKVSVPRLHCKVLQKIETEHCFFWLLTMQNGLIQWNFAKFLKNFWSSGVCD